MLARLASGLPEDDGWVYEPKWDGFRVLVFRGDGIEVQSLDGRSDCVVGGGYHPAKPGVGSLLLRLYDDDGVLQYVGHTSGCKAAEERVCVRELLRPFEGGTSFDGGRMPGGPSRWAAGRDCAWVSLEPRLVVEVRFGRVTGGRFRHAVGFERRRPDKHPEECTPFDQVG